MVIVPSNWPYPPFLARVVLRSALMWLLLRLLSFAALWLTAGVPIALHPNLATGLFLIALTTVLTWWDRRRSRELLLDANLGTSPIWFWTASALTAASLQAASDALLGVAGHP